MNQDNQQAARELLPCPFCGEAPKLHTWSDHGYVRIECESCGFEWDYFHNVNDAAEAWNRRPTPPDSGEPEVSEQHEGTITIGDAGYACTDWEPTPMLRIRTSWVEPNYLEQEWRRLVTFGYSRTIETEWRRVPIIPE